MHQIYKKCNATQEENPDEQLKKKKKKTENCICELYIALTQMKDFNEDEEERRPRSEVPTM